LASAKITGGTKYEAVIKAMTSRLKKSGFVEVGFLANDKYPDGTSIAMVAAIQNFGAPKKKIPPRPFMTNARLKHEKEWPKQLLTILKSNGGDQEQALGQMGAIIKDQIQEEIRETFDPPLSPITVMLRGMKSKGIKVTGKTVGIAAQRVKDGKTNYGASTKPLIDSGDLLNNVHFQVTDKKPSGT